MAMNLGGDYENTTYSTHKRSWPFVSDDWQYSLNRSSSPVVPQPAEPLYLLGSVSRASPSHVYQKMLTVLPLVNVNSQLQTSTYIHYPSLFGSTSPSIALEVSLVGDYFELLHNERPLARLNKGFCIEARRLADFGVKFRAYLQKHSWDALCAEQNEHRHLPGSTTAIFVVDVNVYSFRHHADRIGDNFSQAGFFLQHPTHDTGEVPYYNPQVLVIKGFEEKQEMQTESADDEALEPIEAGISAPIELAVPELQRNASDIVDSILNSLSHNGILHEIRVDRNRISAELLPHQMKAIDFIRQRENGDIPASLTLLKERKLRGETYFQHVLTGAKRPQRDEAKGGIIADDMGLGKTLTVLSAIASSLNDARDFVSNLAGVQSAGSNVPHASRATLILAPSTLLIDSWINEIRIHTYPGGITFHKHLGSERYKETEMRFHFERDIVFSTFATAASELIRGNSPLSKIHWFRIVLDEAHEIRNRSTKQFQAIHALTAQHRWCLTGTPIQNSLEDLGALILFLRVPILDKFPVFRKYIIGPTLSKRGDRFQNLQTLLQTICIRRTRDILGLPETVPDKRLLQLSDRERSEYDALLKRFQIEVQKAVSGRRSNVSATALQSIHELRLFCNNGLRRAGSDAESDDELLSYLQQLDKNACANCSGSIFSIDQSRDAHGGSFVSSSSCKHLVCHSCLPQYYKRKGSCSLCSRGLVFVGTSTDILPTLHFSDGSRDASEQPAKEYPSKLRALLKDLQRESTNKCIVFSSWKKTLDIAAELLTAQGLRHDIIHGGLTLNKRLKALEAFKSPTGPDILLMTLGTGAVGLNLAVATRIYILEPQWNPFVELQAMARAQRLGQTRQVIVIRYIMKGTIEQSNVLNKQKTKEALAGGGFGKDKLHESLQYFGYNV